MQREKIKRSRNQLMGVYPSGLKQLQHTYFRTPVSVHQFLFFWYFVSSPRLIRLSFVLLMETFCLNNVYLRSLPVLWLSLQSSSLKLTPWQRDWAKSGKWKLQNCSSTSQGVLEEVDKSNYNNSSPPPSQLTPFRKHAALIQTWSLSKPEFPMKSSTITPVFLLSFPERSRACLQRHDGSPTIGTTRCSFILGFQPSGFFFTIIPFNSCHFWQAPQLWDQQCDTSAIFIHLNFTSFLGYSFPDFTTGLCTLDTESKCNEKALLMTL